MPANAKKQNHPDDVAYPLLYLAQHREYIEDLPFWLDLAREADGPILELGCGTGRVLVPLVEAGHTVYGLENDPEMFVILHDQILSASAHNAHIFLKDIRTFQFDIKFPLVLIPCNTYSTFPTKERHAALVCVRDHLSSQGIFAISIPNPEVLSRLETSDQAEIDSSFLHPTTGHPVQVSCNWTRSKDNLTIHWYYDHLLPDGRVERRSISIRHFLTSTQEYLHELESAGLKISAIYGDFDYSPHTADSPNLIVVAQKL